MPTKLTEQNIRTIKDAAKRMTKHEKRGFQANVTNDYLGGSSSMAERVFGWGREAVQLGLDELRTGIICLGSYSQRGRKKTEEKLEELENDIHKIVGEKSQVDPKFKTTLKFCKISAKAVCKALEKKKAYNKKLLKIRTMSDVLNRLGYSLKKL